MNLLEKWKAYVENNLKRPYSFSMDSYLIDSIDTQTKRLSSIREDISILYLKKELEKHANIKNIRLLDLLKEKDAFEETLDLFKTSAFISSEGICQNLIEELDKYTGIKLNMDNVENEVLDAAFASLNLTIDSYYMEESSLVSPIKFKLEPTISIKQNMGEAVLSVEKSEDGMYIFHIDNNRDPSGYYSLFYKSGMKIFSFSDRVKEPYPKKSVDNWNKVPGALTIFPYRESFENINSKIVINDLSEDIKARLLLGVLFVFNAIESQECVISRSPVTYVSSLFNSNEESLVVDIHKNFKKTFEVTKEDLLRPFTPYEEWEKWIGEDIALFYSLYGQNFKLDKGALFYFSPDLSTGSFLARRDKMEDVLLFKAKTQLVEHIRKQICDEVESYHGTFTFWKEFLNSNKELILRRIDRENLPYVKEIDEKLIGTSFYNKALVLNEKNEDGSYGCFMKNCEKPDIFFFIKFNDYKEIKYFFNSHLPKIYLGFRRNSRRRNNRSFHIHDPLENVGTIFDPNYELIKQLKNVNIDEIKDPSFIVGFSNEILKK